MDNSSYDIITDREAASRLISKDAPLDSSLQQDFAKALGDSGEECFDIIESIKATLAKISRERFMELVEEKEKATIGRAGTSVKLVLKLC